MRIASDIAQPGWPDPRRDLIEFALTFLEADVMLFRSGYAKRHLIRRLQQSPLTDADVDRVEALLKRAVTAGSGVEEAGAWRRLAAHLVLRGRLPGFEAWVADKAAGAVITLDRANGETFNSVHRDPRLTQTDLDRLAEYKGFRSRWGLVFPGMLEIVDASPNATDPDAKVRRTAHQMMVAIRNRLRSEPARDAARVSGSADVPSFDRSEAASG